MMAFTLAIVIVIVCSIVFAGGYQLGKQKGTRRVLKEQIQNLEN